MTNKIVFISRHKITEAQVLTLKTCGFNNIELRELSFSNDPVQDLKNAHITETTLALVAPIETCCKLLNAGYALYEFKNNASTRKKGLFVCEGVTRLSLILPTPNISIDYTPCPIPIEEQETSNLNY